MPSVMIAVIAAAILIYFSFFAKSEDSAQPELLTETPEDSAVEAKVLDKRITESGIKRHHYLAHVVSFACADGVTRELNVTPKLFEEIKIGESETLVYRDEMFIGFGNHGALEADGGFPSPDNSDGFTLDDYDESIDMERVPEESRWIGYDDETRAFLAKFERREKLPAKSETVVDETDNLSSYSAHAILSKTTLYPFLTQEDDVRRMFTRTYGEALQDLRGYSGNSRKGSAADSVFINKNEIRVVITLQEAPPPLKSHVSAEYGINE